MEITSVAIAALTFAGAAVAQKCADAAISETFARAKAVYRDLFGENPTALDFERQIAIRPELAHRLNADVSAIVEGSPALRRALGAQASLTGVRVLWIDDHPENNSWERTMIRSLGLEIMSVESTRSAEACLQRESFELILSDIARGDQPAEGTLAIPKLRKHALTMPIVFYVGTVRPDLGVPEGAVGITSRPDALIDLVLESVGSR